MFHDTHRLMHIELDLDQHLHLITSFGLQSIAPKR